MLKSFGVVFVAIGIIIGINGVKIENNTDVKASVYGSDHKENNGKKMDQSENINIDPIILYKVLLQVKEPNRKIILGNQLFKKLCPISFCGLLVELHQLLGRLFWL
jgi:hypothetical protein